MNGAQSCRKILSSSAMMGGASLVRILAGLVQMKVAAVALGPAGVGLVGLLQSIMGTASGLASLGLGTAGTRQIAAAAAQERPDDLDEARHALQAGAVILGICGGLAVFLGRGVIADRLAGDALSADEVGWLAVGVAFTVIAGSQRALLNGLRRTRELAVVQIASAVLSASAGVLAIVVWRDNGILCFVLCAPLASFAAGHWYVRRPNRGRIDRAGQKLLSNPAWRSMAGLGAAFMFAGTLASVGHLAVRSIVQNEIGADALGQFQAAWSLSAAYLGIVLAAMATDFYPRLVSVIADPVSARQLVDEQSEVALLLGGPLLIAVMALAPWILGLLYSAQFDSAAEMLRLQIFGDILKLLSWPLGFVLVAAGAGRAYLLCELAAVSVFVLGVDMTLPLVGIEATGLSYVAMYAVYLPLVFWLGGRRIGFKWSSPVTAQFFLLITVAAVLLLIAEFSSIGAALYGCLASAALGVRSLTRLSKMVGLGGPVAPVAALARFFAPRSGVRLGKG